MKIDLSKFKLSKFNPQTLFPLALAEVEKVMIEGEKKYPENNWREIQPYDTASSECDYELSHLSHAQDHIFSYYNYDNNKCNRKEELSHAVTRLLMELEILLGKVEK